MATVAGYLSSNEKAYKASKYLALYAFLISYDPKMTLIDYQSLLLLNYNTSCVLLYPFL